MIQQKKYEKTLANRNSTQEQIELAVHQVERMEDYLLGKGIEIENACEQDLNQYLRHLIAKGENDLEHLLNLARYYFSIGHQENYIYFTAILGGLGVIDNIKKRLFERCGQEELEGVFDGLTEPVLGTPIDEIPAFTIKLMKRLQAKLPKEVYQEVLAGNNHQLPREAMLAEKEAYEMSESLDAYLVGRHQRKVAELEKHYRENRVWFEQKITPAVIDFVKGNQEILSGVRKGNKLYITKIPYDTEKYLNAQTDVEKRYHACHCSFAKKSILTDEVVPGEWCYCSAGFAKFPFEVILDRQLKIELLESPLLGDLSCRFVIDLKNEK